jgi:dienelactone hydrolase
VIKDLQRAVDVLRSRPNVDADRIAYVGFSWGGATGALFVGIERRLKAAALVVGHGGQVSHATGPEGFTRISPVCQTCRLDSSDGTHRADSIRRACQRPVVAAEREVRRVRTRLRGRGAARSRAAAQGGSLV